MENDDHEPLTRDDLIDRDWPVSTSDLLGLEAGDEFWMPISPVRGDSFRALRVEVKERRSAGNYEEENAVEPWDEDAERLNADPTLAGGDS